MDRMKDYGLQYVAPQRVRIDPPIEENWQTTKDGGGGLTRDQINHGIDRHKDVSALYDKGYSDQDFQRMRESSDPNDKAIGDSQRMFWGDHPISVTKNGDDLVSDNGRHRLDAAQSSNTDRLPMRVHAAADDPEFADKPFDAARHPEHQEREARGDDMSERGRHSPETPELNNSQEKRPQVDEHPTLRPARDDAQQSQSDGDMSGHQQAPPNDQKSAGDGHAETKHDPMDGDHKRAGSEPADHMDGASDKGPKPELDASDIADTKRAIG